MFSTPWVERLDPRRWTLAVRLTLFFSSAISAIVMLVSAMMYVELVHQLHEKDQLEVREEMEIRRALLRSVDRRLLPSHLQHEGSEQDEVQDFSWLRLSAGGRATAVAGNAAQFSPALDGAAAPGKYVWLDGDGPAPARSFLRHDMPLGADEGGGVLRGVLDVSHDAGVLRRYRAKLAGVLIMAVMLSGAIGWWLARRGLAPVRAMSAEIGRVSAERLNVRIARQVWPADVRVLAETFDGLMDRIERSFVRLSQFSSDLAHEFRSPISNLVAAASVTLSGERTPDQYRDALGTVVEEGGRLSRLVSLMLFLARADNARQVVRIEALSTMYEFRKLLEFFEGPAEEQGIRVDADGDLALHADPTLLRQALVNLLANALRHTGRGGRVQLRAVLEGEQVALSVTDDGIGIAAEHLPFLFERFYRVDAARSSADNSGLGLAVVKSIAELHGGTASVRSSPGAGAVFELRLPAEPPAAAPFAS